MMITIAGNPVPDSVEYALSGTLIPAMSGILLAAAVRTKWTFCQQMFRLFVLGVMHTLYRVRVVGMENWPQKGPVVIVGNHTSWLDGILLMMFARRRMKAIAWSGNFRNPLMTWLSWFTETILISGGPKAIVKSLGEARQALLDGLCVGIFPEGAISRTGQIQGMRPGLTRILKDTDATVIPMYIDQVWGSIFTFAGGKSIWKIPRSFRHRITIHIGKPVENAGTMHEVRQSLQLEGALAVKDRQPPFVSPVQSFIRSSKRQKFRFKAADSSGSEITGGSALMRSLILRRLLRRHVLSPDEQHVGVLIPPSVGGLVTNLALALDRRVAINLNYTVSNPIMDQCVEKADIRTILTSKKVLEKFDFRFNCKVVCLEDLRDKVSVSDKIAGAAGSFLVPASLLERSLGLRSCNPDETLTIIFTSGSTGIPKGVMLTHRNIGSNVEAIDQVIKLRRNDVLLGILPFFHSFGYTVTLWGGMALPIAVAYHVSPLDVGIVGKLCEKHNVTILLSTPTFLRGYLRKCTPENFHKLDVVVAGAEKLPAELSDAFEKKFGVRPVEGYGTTELSPLVSVNVPPSRKGDSLVADSKEGSVGRPVPNVAAQVRDLDSGKVLGVNQEGRLWITGPNVMKGYLKEPEKTSQVIVDGWYDTGDVAVIDDEGFITITGRLSRFSKIGGEMIPHVIIEDTLGKLLDEDEQDQQRFAVTAVGDPKKGEKLIVLHTALRKSPSEYIQGLSAAGLPNLYLPAANAFYQVESLPVLGTGKLDLKAMREVADQRARSASE